METPPAPPQPPSTIPKKDTFIDAAKSVYGFTPEAASTDPATAEHEFKKNYAKEAINAGLTEEQVSRVYSFETAGIGKADEQPIRKDGTAISTALGYSQVLNATSVELMQKHGEEWAQQLEKAGKPEKADVLRRMTADARKAGSTEEEFQAFAKTPAGRAIHAANLDVDVGPKMQMQNLVDIKKTGEKLGVTDANPGALELMNLAGEKNGAAMLKPELKDLPAANFFTRAGYEANPVVANRTGAQLLDKIEKTMDLFMTKPGTQDLLAAFREVRAVSGN
jgi:hypothetical protein